MDDDEQRAREELERAEGELADAIARGEITPRERAECEALLDVSRSMFAAGLARKIARRRRRAVAS